MSDYKAERTEIEQLREAVTFNGDQVTQVAHENAMLRAENARMREALRNSLDFCDTEDSEAGAAFARIVNAMLATNETPTA